MWWAVLCSCVLTTIGTDVLRLGLMFPISNKESGANRAAGAMMAVNQINSRDPVVLSLAKDIRIQIEVCLNDTALDASTSVTKTLFQVQQFGAHSLVGPSSSGICMPTSVVAATFGTPQSSYSCTAAELSNSKVFKTFFRVVPSDSVQGQALAEVVTAMGWRRVALVLHDGAYGQGIGGDFERSLPQEVQIISRVAFAAKTTDPDDTNLRGALEASAKSGARIFLLAADSGEVTAVLLAAKKMGLLGPAYVWIGSDGVMDALEGSSTEVVQIQEAKPTILGTTPKTGGTVEYDNYLETWANSKPSDFPEVEEFLAPGKDGESDMSLDKSILNPSYWGQAMFDQPPNSMTVNAYDAVMAFAVAADNLVGSGQNITANGILRQLQDPKFDFIGATGHVTFDSQGDRRGSYLLMNMQAGALVTVGTWDAGMGLSEGSVDRIDWPLGVPTVDGPSREMMVGDKLIVSFSAPLLCWTFLVGVLGAWVGLILVEDLLYSKQKDQSIVVNTVQWLLAISVCSSFCAQLVFWTACELVPVQDGYVEVLGKMSFSYDIAYLFLALACSIGFSLAGLMLYLFDPAVEARRTTQNLDTGATVHAYSSKKQTQDRLVRERALARKSAGIAFLLTIPGVLGAVALTGAVVGCYFFIEMALVGPVTSTLQGSVVTAGAMVSLVMNFAYMKLVFFLFGKRRFIAAVVMGLGTLATCLINVQARQWIYQGQNGSTAVVLTTEVAWVVASVVAVFLSLGLLVLQFLRLRVTRSMMSHALRSMTMEAQRLNKRIDDGEDREDEQLKLISLLNSCLDLINLSRPIMRAHGVSVALRSINMKKLRDGDAEHPQDVVFYVKPDRLDMQPSDHEEDSETDEDEDSIIGSQQGTAPNSTPSTPRRTSAIAQLPVLPEGGVQPGSSSRSAGGSERSSAGHDGSDDSSAGGSLIAVSGALVGGGGGAEGKVVVPQPLQPSGSSIIMHKHARRSAEQPGVLARNGRMTTEMAKNAERLLLHIPTLAQERQDGKHMQHESHKEIRREESAEFAAMLNNPVCLEVIKDVLVARHSVELIMCYVDLVFYSKVSSKTARAAMGRALYNEYLKTGSPNEVNISGPLRAQMKSLVRKGRWHAGMFEEVEACMVRMMFDNMWTSFRASESYGTCVLFLDIFSDISEAMLHDAKSLPQRRQRHGRDYFPLSRRTTSKRPPRGTRAGRLGPGSKSAFGGYQRGTHSRPTVPAGVPLSVRPPPSNGGSISRVNSESEQKGFSVLAPHVEGVAANTLVSATSQTPVLKNQAS